MCEDKWKKWSWGYGTADAIVFEGPGFLSFGKVCAKDDRKVVVTFHNGVNANADIKLRLRTGTGVCDSDSPPVPIFFDRGCFVNIDDHTQCWHAQYREV